MFNKLATPKTHSYRYFALLGLLIVALFIAGLKIGTLLTGTTTIPVAAEAARPAAPGAAVVNPPTPLHDFTLTDQTGKPFSLSQLRGRVTLLFFGYTHCPDECPTTLANFKRVKESLGNAARDVAFVFISVDGPRDTPDVMADYLQKFDTAFIGLTGDEHELQQVGSDFGALFSYEKVAADDTHDQDHHDASKGDLDHENYFVEHTSPAFLIDRDGQLRLVYFYGAAADAIADGARQLLALQ